MSGFRVRYIVDDVDSSLDFYTRALGFETLARPGPGFAMVQRDQLVLLLSSATGGGGAGTALSDGARPEPGGWNRVQLLVDDLDGSLEGLREAGVHPRDGIIDGRGGRQALVADPSGNLVELFEPHRG